MLLTSGRWRIKVLSEMDVALRYSLLTVLTLFSVYTVDMVYSVDMVYTAQCAVWAIRWPCGILAIAVKTLSHRETIFLRLFFLCSYWKKT